MKHLLRSFTGFTTREKTGIFGLLSLLLLLFCIRCCMHYAVHPADAKEQARLEAAWAAFRDEHKAIETEIETTTETDATATATLFPFDPNTLDSEGFRRLGLTAKTTRLLLNWRRKGKHFYAKDDLKPLYTLTAEAYARLEPYISITATAPPWQSHAFHNDYAPLPATIDLNRTDSAMLVRLNGIGPTLAHKIVERRKALGGFLRHEQLLEVYRFSDTVFKMLKEKLVIDAGAVKKLSLNKADFDQLKMHPYIGEKTARNILLFREGLKRFENIEQLRQVPLMNEEIYRKIAPYFVLE
jgi:DNA uptake protein ComE-like DNA-binding protein